MRRPYNRGKGGAKAGRSYVAPVGAMLVIAVFSALAVWDLRRPHSTSSHVTSAEGAPGVPLQPLPQGTQVGVPTRVMVPKATPPWESTPENTPDPGPGYIPAWKVNPPRPEELPPPPPPVPPPDPMTTRPPMDNPGGVNGTRPPRPVPGLDLAPPQE